MILNPRILRYRSAVIRFRNSSPFNFHPHGWKNFLILSLVSNIESDWTAKTVILQRSTKRIINKYVDKLIESIKYLSPIINSIIRSCFFFPCWRAGAIFLTSNFLEIRTSPLFSRVWKRVKWKIARNREDRAGGNVAASGNKMKERKVPKITARPAMERKTR